MPTISWNEIRQRAIAFGRDWQHETRENAEAQTFWNEFLNAFGVHRRTVASFEEPVRNLGGGMGRIDLFWKGVLLAEHKSAGESLDKATSQAMDYIQSLARDKRDKEIPRYIIVSDFATIALHDLESNEPAFHCRVEQLHEHVQRFAFIAGYETRTLDPEDPANVEAAEILAKLHDALKAGNYPEHDLERFMVRVLFCLFAEDTGLFGQPETFELYIKNTTREDGSDLGLHLRQFFEVLNTPTDQRQANLDEQLADLPWVNGDLFADRLPAAAFNSDMRNRLLSCCTFSWKQISPAVFGSLFQSIMEAPERRQIGAHYTSERDIMKLIRSLFLDDLRSEFERLKNNKAQLRRFHERLGTLNFLDPACGCGNFLVIAYRELRKLEIDILQTLHPRREQRVLDIRSELHIDVDQFFGIEIDQWPARIAEVAMWLMDHQMNIEVSTTFGQNVLRLPLECSATIRCANALRIDWNEVLPADECSFVLGNPPFVGHHYQSKEQKEDRQIVLADISARGVLDYVTNWYVRALEYVGDRRISCAFVSTNSITQGEQTGILWSYLFAKFGVKIHFAHRTFAWASEARGKAHVHVVILGFGRFDVDRKTIYDYADDEEHPHAVQVANISPYLTDGPDVAITNRSKPLSDVPKMSWGNKPTDGGNLILEPEEQDEFLAREPRAAKWIRPYLSGGDFLNGRIRYCLWLPDAPPDELRQLPQILKRVEAVRDFRLASKAAATRKYAAHPTLFRQIAQPNTDYLALSEVSSERRDYIPIAYLASDVICSNTIQFIPNATPYHFGILHSAMHMAWVRQVCGRLESRYRYSSTLVYNNFPWPESPTDAQRAAVEAAAQSVLDARAAHPNATLADLYDPLTMPRNLAQAHAKLDRAVEKCYRPQPFPDERRRFEYLFAMWERLTTPLTAGKKKKKKKKK